MSIDPADPFGPRDGVRMSRLALGVILGALALAAGCVAYLVADRAPYAQCGRGPVDNMPADAIRRRSPRYDT